MATTFISIDTTKRLGGQARGAVDQLQAAKQALAKLKAIMDTQIDLAPSPADYSLVESQFGLQAGKGQTFYNLVAGVNSDVGASSNVTQLLNWCG
jgi:hypothetical protein